MVKKIHFLPALVIALVLIIVGSFCDLNISSSVVNQSSIYAKLFSSIGELGVYGTWGFVGGGLLFYSLVREKTKWRKIFGIFVSLLMSIMACFLISRSFISLNGWMIPDKWYIGFPVGFVLIFGLYGFGFIVFKKSPAENKDLSRFIFLTCIITLLSVLLALAMKYIICRPRYRWLVTDEGRLVGEFKNWWQSGRDIKKIASETFNTDAAEFASFPSYHTVGACCAMVTLVYLPLINSKLEKIKMPLFYIGLLWGLIVSSARLLKGDHFMSDIGFAFLIFVVCFFVLDIVVNKILDNQKMQKLFVE